ncbi:hypothetical protein RRG08_009829 [Elysia crispata]|uniref:Ankyrin repeat protein n=1 Tax=Elysia crispata TaxID=231223 RepID=A0AAE0Z3Y8_9GAST|nr:hypothetical protein RRG08_009829 [Elysia crispata]
MDPTFSRRDRFCVHSMITNQPYDRVRWLVKNGFPPLDLDCSIELHRCMYRHSTPISPLAIAISSKQPDTANYLITNRFSTRFDVIKLCWDQAILRALHIASDENEEKSLKARQCEEILNFLSERPQSLKTLCCSSWDDIQGENVILRLFVFGLFIHNLIKFLMST